MDDQTRIRKLQLPTGRIRLVIDSDAKNEIDDQYAIAWALRSPERFRVEAVYAAPFSHSVFERNIGNAWNAPEEFPAEGMEESWREIITLYGLLEEDPHGHVFRGAERYIAADMKPVLSDAVRDLIQRGMREEEPLYVASIGAPTNIASALLSEPRLAEHLVVVWLGGQPPYFPYGYEFNMAQDIRASQVLFDSGVPMIWIPCMGVASLLSFSEDDARCRLQGKSRIGSYLAELLLNQVSDPGKAAARAARYRTCQLRGREDQEEAYFKQFESRYAAWSRTIWDVSTIAFLKNPGWVQTMRIPSPILREDLSYGRCDPSRHSIRVATYCQRDLIFGDMIACLNRDTEA